MDNDREYDVGYGKPPKAFQFKKGKSGNSRGRPRKDPGIASIFRKISNQKVRTNGQNGQQSMTKLEATMTQLVNKSASGDLKATKLILQMATKFPELITGPQYPSGIKITFLDPTPDEIPFDPSKSDVGGDPVR
jgi:hypothetical protein